MELKVAVCLYADVQLLDFAGPLDLLAFVAEAQPPSPVTFRLAQLSTHPDTVSASGGLVVKPTCTYAQALASGAQYDVLLVPGGTPLRLIHFPTQLTQAACRLGRMARQNAGRFGYVSSGAGAGRATYVLSVCTGSWILQQAGLLAGRRATTNKSLFNIISTASAGEVSWVRRARWVVDGKFWTASGVAAGLDMTLAFISHVAGPAVSASVSNDAEYGARARDDDPFAEIWSDEAQRRHAEASGKVLVA